jgi:hypothetical protein
MGILWFSKEIKFIALLASVRQFGMKVYTKLVMIMELETLPHHKIHKLTWMSLDRKIHNQTDHILIGNGIQVHLLFDHLGQQTVILTTVWWWQKIQKD